jgi:hypothetical protein
LDRRRLVGHRTGRCCTPRCRPVHPGRGACRHWRRPVRIRAGLGDVGRAFGAVHRRPVDRHHLSDAAPAAGRPGPVLVADPPGPVAGHGHLPARSADEPPGLRDRDQSAPTRAQGGAVPAPAGRCRRPHRPVLRPPPPGGCRGGGVGDRVPPRLRLDPHSWGGARGPCGAPAGCDRGAWAVLLGLSWQHTRGSALLGFVNDDAAYLADRIATDPGTGGSAPAGVTGQPSR